MRMKSHMTPKKLTRLERIVASRPQQEKTFLLGQNVTVSFDQEKLEDDTGSGNDDELSVLKDYRNGTTRIPECSKTPLLYSLIQAPPYYTSKRFWIVVMFRS